MSAIQSNTTLGQSPSIPAATTCWATTATSPRRTPTRRARSRASGFWRGCGRSA